MDVHTLMQNKSRESSYKEHVKSENLWIGWRVENLHFSFYVAPKNTGLIKRFPESCRAWAQWDCVTKGWWHTLQDHKEVVSVCECIWFCVCVCVKECMSGCLFISSLLLVMKKHNTEVLCWESCNSQTIWWNRCLPKLLWATCPP